MTYHSFLFFVPCLLATITLNALDRKNLISTATQTEHVFDCSQCPKGQSAACIKSLEGLRADTLAQLKALSSPAIVGQMVRQEIERKKQKNLRLICENDLAPDNAAQATFDYEIRNRDIAITINMPAEFNLETSTAYEKLLSPWRACTSNIHNGTNASSIKLNQNGLVAIKTITLDPSYNLDLAGNFTRRISTKLCISGGTLAMTPIQQEAVRLYNTENQHAAITYMNAHAAEFPKKERNYFMVVAATLGVIAVAKFVGSFMPAM
jgi:hypothetical protein